MITLLGLNFGKEENGYVNKSYIGKCNVTTFNATEAVADARGFFGGLNPPPKCIGSVKLNVE